MLRTTAALARPLNPETAQPDTPQPRAIVPNAPTRGGERGLVAPAVFKTVVSARKRRRVGSIPTRLRQAFLSIP